MHTSTMGVVCIGAARNACSQALPVSAEWQLPWPHLDFNQPSTHTSLQIRAACIVIAAEAARVYNAVLQHHIHHAWIFSPFLIQCKEFLWQDDLVGVANFVNDCLNKACNAVSGPSHDGQASDQLDVAGRDVKWW